MLSGEVVHNRKSHDLVNHMVIVVATWQRGRKLVLFNFNLYCILLPLTTMQMSMTSLCLIALRSGDLGEVSEVARDPELQ